MRLGTRGSALALAQARLVAEALGDGAEIVPIRTAGDRGEAIGDKARWVDAIEAALLAGEIDLAVHSAKDVPSELADGLELVGALAREDPRDALVGAPSVEALAPGARIGTSSLRRRAELLAVRDDLDVVEIRGNVDTRLRKLAAGEVDALVLAAAGLRRLGRGGEVGALLDPDVFVPAPGQGVIAVEGREIPPRLVDPATDAALRTERRVVHALGATCHTPVGVYDDGSTVRAFVGRPDGSAWVRDEVGGDGAAELLVSRLRSVGAMELIEA